MKSPFVDTLDSREWILRNEQALKAMLPEQWTDCRVAGASKMAITLKLLGVDWQSCDEFGAAMVRLEHAGVMLRQGLMIKRNPHPCFTPVVVASQHIVLRPIL